MYRRLFIKSLYVVTLVLFASSLAGYSLLEAGYEPYFQTDGLGNYVGITDARSGAMGGAGVFGGQRFLDTTINPASIMFLDPGYGGEINYGLMRTNDRRSMPIYSFFDEYVDEGTCSYNSDWYDEAAIGGYYMQDISRAGFGVGLSYTPRLNFDATYNEDVRNDDSSDDNQYPFIIAKNSIESEGAIRSTNLAIAGSFSKLGFVDLMSLGVQIAFYEGEHNRTKRIEWTDEARQVVQNFELPDYYEKMGREFSGTGFNIGFNLHFADHYGFAFTYTPKTELEVDYSYKLDSYQGQMEADLDVDDFVMPSRMRFGLLYKPQNVMKTFVNVDMEIVNWSEVEDYYDDAINFYLGVEHRVYETMPIRIGFRYETLPIDSIAMPTFTCGTGFEVYGPLRFDFSIEYSHRKYQGEDLFPESYYNDENYAESASYESQLWNYVVPTDRTESDKVDETFLKFQSALTLTF